MQSDNNNRFYDDRITVFTNVTQSKQRRPGEEVWKQNKKKKDLILSGGTVWDFHKFSRASVEFLGPHSATTSPPVAVQIACEQCTQNGRVRVKSVTAAILFCEERKKKKKKRRKIITKNLTHNSGTRISFYFFSFFPNRLFSTSSNRFRDSCLLAVEMRVARI